jgi:hypothetical protein
MDYLGSKFDLLLEESDHKKIEQSIIDYITLLKKTKSYSAIHNNVSAIIAFYKINDIVLNINKISNLCPIKANQIKIGHIHMKKSVNS